MSPSATPIFNTRLTGSGTLGSLGGGLVYEAFGARAMFLAATAVVGAAGLMALVAVPARTRSLTDEVALPAPEVAPAVP